MSPFQSISFEMDPIATLSIRRSQSISIEIDCKTRYWSISIEIDRKDALQSSMAPEPLHTLAVMGQLLPILIHTLCGSRMSGTHPLYRLYQDSYHLVL